MEEEFSVDKMHELVDVNAMLALALSGTASSLAGAALAARHNYRRLYRLNGLFMVACAGFITWRDKLASDLGPRRDTDREELQEGVSSVVVDDAGRVKHVAPAMVGPQWGPGNLPRTQEDVARLELLYTSTPFEKLPRFILMGFLAGGLLGYFGVGPTWVIAPLVTRTSPEWEQIASLARGKANDYDSLLRQFMPLPKQEPVDEGPSEGPLTFASDLITSMGCDDRTRRTCSMAMILPCLAAAWRHWLLGHVVDPNQVAFPLAAGAICGSFGAGQMLGDMPPDADTRMGLSVLLFSYGIWSIFSPR
ncbi:unnamed protein product [Effrenium voratum]|uniref:Uncharacterized protein n=1 Tax=Effrenium voratum TaxID=2562239 RepID=A0AA36NDF7_9DINO|nr:unnamed protein product [Effrenium voratum]